jgi:tRNA (cmo5U34)-methyltransferase
MKIRELFDQCATEYDRDRQALVPCFDEFYSTVLRVIPFASQAGIHVLDLGAGTGLLSAMVAKVFPAASLHLTDISEAMLAQARQRFADNPLVTYALQEHTQLAATAEYDLVISALSIHHLEDSDKQVLFKKIYRALCPGGMFINADQARSPSPGNDDQYEQQWLEDVKVGNISESALAQTIERMREDRNAPLSSQLKWLVDAGFDDVDCWYERFRFVVYGGIKTAMTGD